MKILLNRFSAEICEKVKLFSHMETPKVSDKSENRKGDDLAERGYGWQIITTFSSDIRFLQQGN